MTIGPFTFTRDSALWIWGIVAAVVAALATLDQQTAVETFGIPLIWLPKIRLASFIVGVVSGVATSSPFKHSDDLPGRSVTKLAPVILIALALGATSCASLGGARHRATVSVVSVHAVLAAVQDGETLLVCGRATAPPAPQCVPMDTHRAISAKLAVAFDYDGKVAQLVRASAATAGSADVASLLGQVQAIIDAVFRLIPDSVDKQALVAKVGAR